ncbi:MAG: sugar ABC transporter ATP-binding protein, partial [Candidatus Caldatribacteriaceae bacterium]
MVGEREPLLVLKNISKEFPGVKALSEVSLEVFPGEIHAVLGENGAGKSTLMKILSGIVRKDSGEIILAGKKVDFKGPKDAISAGIALVQQELSLVPYLSVAENIFLGRWQRKGLGVNWKLLKSEAEKLLQRFNLSIDPQVAVEKLSVAEQQIVEIIKAIAKPQVQVFLLDEPTSALGEKEIARLFELLSEIRKEGKAIIFISHKINEALAISDRITILRDGGKIITALRKDLTERDVVLHMTGKTWEREKEVGIASQREKENPVLILRGFSVDDFVKDVNLELARGEILVVFGLVGSGRTTLAEGLFGLRRHTGKFFLDGREVELSSPLEA